MIRFLLAGIFILAGLLILGIATYGIFRFQYVLNRIHVAAKCDSLGAVLICVGLMFLSASPMVILKLLLIIIFVWLTNPVANYLISQTEVATNPDIEKECEVEVWS